MPEPPDPTDFNPRMHQGGKLSFRGRGQREEGDTGGLVRLGGRNPPPLRELVPAGFAEVAIEIGSGKGAFLRAAAAQQPDTFLLGIEAAVAYAETAAARLHQDGRKNALLLVDNGKLYLQDRVEAGALAAVHVYYPDPWPKRRHKGRRFFTDDAPQILAHALRDLGWLYFASDNAAYAGQVARVMGSSGLFRRDVPAERRIQQGPPGVAFSPTNFEIKYLAEGRILRRYAFQRVAR